MTIQDLFVQGEVPVPSKKKQITVRISEQNLERLQAILDIIFQKTGRKISKSKLAVLATENFLKEATQYLKDLGIEIPE